MACMYVAHAKRKEQSRNVSYSNRPQFMFTNTSTCWFYSLRTLAWYIQSNASSIWIQISSHSTNNHRIATRSKRLAVFNADSRILVWMWLFYRTVNTLRHSCGAVNNIRRFLYGLTTCFNSSSDENSTKKCASPINRGKSGICESAVATHRIVWFSRSKCVIIYIFYHLLSYTFLLR